MIYFLSPFYNEEEFLPKFLNDLEKSAKRVAVNGFKIVLVDDGSQDGSLSIVESFKKKLPILVISYKPNKGVDYAFKTGFKKIFKIAKNGDLIVTLESDNTSDLNILHKMIERSKKGVDIILASCYAKGGGVYGTGIFRQTASKVANLLLYIIFPIKNIKTYSSFYRLYKVGPFKKAWNSYNKSLISQKGFVCMAEMLIKLSKLPLKIEEVPMVLKWEGRRGKSKMKIGKTIFGYWFLFRDLFLKETFGETNVIKNAQSKWIISE